jgi:hypothetical protein
MAKPSVVAIPTTLPPCSKASGIIVSASIARIPPAAKVRTKEKATGEDSEERRPSGRLEIDGLLDEVERHGA